MDRAEIMYSARESLFVGDNLLTIEDVSMAIKKMRAQKQKFKWTLGKRLKKDYKDREVFIIELYDKHEKMIDDYWREDIQINELMKEEIKQFTVQQIPLTPLYIQELIEKRLLYPDGKRATGTLLDIGSYFKGKIKIPIRRQFFLEMFLKDNGKKWSNSSARDAVEEANSQLLTIR